jgi:response regulator NasT
MSEARLLIADSDHHGRTNLRQKLENLGYLVVGEATESTEALSITRQLRPDVVLIDMELRDGKGLDVANTIHEEKLAPVIIVAAYSTRNLTDRACKAGVLASLIKPMQESELMPAIELVRARWNDYCNRYREVLSLREQIETRTMIEQAKGFLMDSQGLGEAEAFRKIQKLAMNNRKTMGEIAQAIVLAQQIQI